MRALIPIHVILLSLLLDNITYYFISIYYDKPRSIKWNIMYYILMFRLTLGIFLTAIETYISWHEGASVFSHAVLMESQTFLFAKYLIFMDDLIFIEKNSVMSMRQNNRQINNEIEGEMDNEIESKLDVKIDNQIEGEIEGEIEGKLDVKIDNEIEGEIGDKVEHQNPPVVEPMYKLNSLYIKNIAIGIGMCAPLIIVLGTLPVLFIRALSLFVHIIVMMPYLYLILPIIYVSYRLSRIHERNPNAIISYNNAINTNKIIFTDVLALVYGWLCFLSIPGLSLVGAGYEKVNYTEALYFANAHRPSSTDWFNDYNIWHMCGLL